MELVVVNGSSSIARGVIQSLLKSNNYSKLRFLDFRPYRKGVYQLQRSIGPSIAFDKHMTQSASNIEIALEGSQEVVYFTHDYVTQTGDKNSFIKTTSNICKKLGIQKLISVCPVEHELYYTEDSKNPWQHKEDAQRAALSSNPSQAIINTNLVFGKNAYLLQYIAQGALDGKLSGTIGGEGRYRYHPIHTDDIATVIQTSLSKFDEVKGQTFNLSGEEGVTKGQILKAIERSVGKSGTALGSSFNVLDLLHEFMVGNTHDTNLEEMVKFFESQNIDLKANDIQAKLGITPQVKFSEFYGSTKLTAADLSTPERESYKEIALD